MACPLRERILNAHHGILARGSLGIILVRVLGLLVTFALQKQLIACMGESSYGMYVYVLAWLQSLCLISLLGLDQVLIRFLASYRITNEWELFHGLHRWTKRLLILSGLVGAACTAAGAWLLRNHMSQECYWAFLAGSALLWVKGLQEFYRAALQGIQKPVQAILPRILLVPLLMVVCITAMSFLWQIKGLAAWQVLELELVLTFALLFLSHLWFTRSHRSYPTEQESSTQPNYWTRTALPLWISSGTVMINMQMGKILLGIFRTHDDVGIFNIALEISLLLTFGLTSVNMISAPLIAELHAKQDRKGMQNVLTWSMLAVLGITVPSGLVLVFFGRTILGFFGANYVQGYSSMLILLAGFFLQVLAGPVGVILSMTGRQKRFSVLVLAEGSLSFTLGYLLIPSMGLLGASIAMAVSNVLLRWTGAISILRTASIDSTVLCLWNWNRN